LITLRSPNLRKWSAFPLFCVAPHRFAEDFVLADDVRVTGVNPPLHSTKSPAFAEQMTFSRRSKQLCPGGGWMYSTLLKQRRMDDVVKCREA
jgi:hypothetical protein